MQPDRRLCGNAAHERTSAPVASRSPPDVRFTDTIAPLHRFITASPRIQNPTAPRIHQHCWPSRPINRHSLQDSGRIGALRGFLHRGLFDACQHAQRHRHIPVVDGRHRITLNGSGTINGGQLGGSASDRVRPLQPLVRAMARTSERQLQPLQRPFGRARDHHDGFVQRRVASRGPPPTLVSTQPVTHQTPAASGAREAKEANAISLVSIAGFSALVSSERVINR
ncbi:hypothetical protein P3T25_009691 [Paraburkholderia sp. GAS32]